MVVVVVVVVVVGRGAPMEKKILEKFNYSMSIVLSKHFN